MLLGRNFVVAVVIVAAGFLGAFIYLFAELGAGHNASENAGSLHFKKSSFDWSTVKQYHPVESLTPLPIGAPKTLPLVQFDFPSGASDSANNTNRRNAVRDAFVRSWSSYKQRAWLHDELTPVSGGQKDTLGGWGVSLVDTLDTLWIMDLKDEFYQAAEAAVKIDWNQTADWGLNVFEVTIRHLGGLLSAHDLSGEPALLLKAQELENMLYMAFDTPNRLPDMILNFEHAQDGSQVAGARDASAGPTSLSLEFTRLAQLTGEDKYYDAIDRVRAFLERTQNQTYMPGMWPAKIDFQTESVIADNSFHLGGEADSLYEYLLKMYVLLSGQDEARSYETMYRNAMDVVTNHLLFRPMLPDRRDILFPGIIVAHNESFNLDAEGQHLACFSGGMLALGGKILGVEEHIDIGRRIALGCAWAYKALPTGIMPEAIGLLECRTAGLQPCDWDDARWNNEGDLQLAHGIRDVRDRRYLLRPEAIESLFILYRISGDESVRDVAWGMFQDILNATQTSYAYSSIKDVTATGETEKLDSMESFWLSETLKYLYLMFSPPTLISLDEYVLNTEAHPFRRADWAREGAG